MKTASAEWRERVWWRFRFSQGAAKLWPTQPILHEHGVILRSMCAADAVVIKSNAHVSNHGGGNISTSSSTVGDKENKTNKGATAASKKGGGSGSGSRKASAGRRRKRPVADGLISKREFPLFLE